MNLNIVSRVWCLAILLAASTAYGEVLPSDEAAAALPSIQQSHIEGNVPAKPDFDRLIRRDLGAYFAKPGEPAANVNYELLRDEPTQVGVCPAGSGALYQSSFRIRAAELARSRVPYPDPGDRWFRVGAT
jgi:hypothetical protein